MARHAQGALYILGDSLGIPLGLLEGVIMAEGEHDFSLQIFRINHNSQRLNRPDHNCNRVKFLAALHAAACFPVAALSIPSSTRTPQVPPSSSPGGPEAMGAAVAAGPHWLPHQHAA